MASANSRLLGGGDCGAGHFQLVGLFANEVIKNVHWHWEDDSRVVLGGYAAQRLEVAELREEKEMRKKRPTIHFVLYQFQMTIRRCFYFHDTSINFHWQKKRKT